MVALGSSMSNSGSAVKSMKSVLAVSFAVVFDGFADFGGGEDVALLQREDGLERFDFERESFIGVGADDFQRAHLVALAFFDGDGDVDGFAVGAAGERDAEFVALRVVIFEDRAVGRDDDLEVAVVLIVAANADFEIFGELFGVVGLAENRDVPEVERNRVRAIVAHGADELAIAEGVVAGELDVADFNFRAFLNLEDEDDGVAGSDALVLRRDGGELAAVLAEQFLQDDFGFLDARRVEAAFDGEADFALFEAIENVGLGDRVDAVVADAANDGALSDFEDDVFVIGAVGRIFDAELYVFEKLRVPESLEIAAERFLIIRIAFAREDAGL